MINIPTERGYYKVHAKDRNGLTYIKTAYYNPESSHWIDLARAKEIGFHTLIIPKEGIGECEIVNWEDTVE